jgi:hypothetical protein
MAYIYQADIYCDDCGRAILNRIRAEYGDSVRCDFIDSDDAPIHCRDNEESDCPQHCGAGEHCLNAIKLTDGKVGLLIGELTQDGVEYVKEAIAEGGEVAELWKRHYAEMGYNLGEYNG